MRLLETIHNLDLRTFEWCLKRKNRILAITISRASSRSADGPLYILTGVLVLLLQEWYLACLMAGGFLAERSCYTLFKGFFKRNRPPAAIPGFCSVIEPTDQFSFPSGHTSAAFLVACIFASAFPWAAWLLYPWAITVGISRVVLGVHFPSDVIAGAGLGYTLASLLIALYS